MRIRLLSFPLIRQSARENVRSDDGPTYHFREQQMDDWDLLEQFRLARCERGLGELFGGLAGCVRAPCRRRVGAAPGAEDAARAVFLGPARRPPARSGS